MTIQSLEQGNQLFIERMKKYRADFFEQCSQGQKPEYFVIACSDSRTDPESVTSSLPGTIFAHRNIANIVDEEDNSFRAGLYYALVALNVDAIIILGHTGCGGVKAAHEKVSQPEILPWVSLIENSLSSYPIDERTPSLEELERHNIRVQVKNVLHHPVYIQEGNSIPVIGGLFHTESGELEWIHMDT